MERSVASYENGRKSPSATEGQHMNHTMSLGRQFRGSSGSQVIDLELDPAGAVQCPFCHDGYVQVFDDQLLKANWLYCRACCFSGDPIALCCRLWNAPVELVIQRL